MLKEQVILEKTYDSESIIDMDEDVHWALNESELPHDDDGMVTGHFDVVITWREDES